MTQSSIFGPLYVILVVIVAASWVTFAPTGIDLVLPNLDILRDYEFDTLTRTISDFDFECGTGAKLICHGELWLPKAVDPSNNQANLIERPPVVIMAHGFGSLYRWRLPFWAEHFTRSGMAVLLFDYQSFGRSQGEPRHIVDGEAHVQDWLDAIHAIYQSDKVDGSRIGLWGSSYSGGHTLAASSRLTGSLRQSVKAVSAQVPFVDGLASSLNYPLLLSLRLAWYGLHDLLRSFTNQQPLYVPVAGNFPDTVVVLECPECQEGFDLFRVPADAEPVPHGVAARVFLTLPLYSPARHVERIAEHTHVLIIAAQRDGLIPIEAVRGVAQRLGSTRAEYVELAEAHHFSVYEGALRNQVVQKQTQFFMQHL